MPTPLHNPEQFSVFKRWFNSHRNDELNPAKYRFSHSDIDIIIYRIETFWFLLFMIEAKGHQKDSSTNWRGYQQELCNILNGTFEELHGKTISLFSNDKLESKRFWYLGYHVVCYENEIPSEDKKIWWDGKEIDLATLYKCLRFDLDPRSIKPFDASEFKSIKKKRSGQQLRFPSGEIK